MNNNLVSISNVKENVLEFAISITGIEKKDMMVKFVIEANNMEIGFNAKSVDDKDKWTVEIPALTMLKATLYPFHIEVVVDGYHFLPMQGSVNVVGTHEIYLTKPENITLEPAKTKPVAKDIVQNVTTKKKDDSKLAKQKQPNTDKPTAPVKVKTVRHDDSKELFKTIAGGVEKEKDVKTDNNIDIKVDKITDILKNINDINVKADSKSSKKPAKKPTAKLTGEIKRIDKNKKIT